MKHIRTMKHIRMMKHIHTHDEAHTYTRCVHTHHTISHRLPPSFIHTREWQVFSERIQAQNDTLSRSLMLSALALLSLLPSSMTYLQLLLSSTALLTALYTLFTSKHIPTSVPDTIASRTSSAFTVYQPQRSAIPPPAEWPHRPLCLVDNVDGPPLPIGREIAIDSEMFSGKLLLRVAGAPCDDPADSAKYFLGRRRRFQVIIQGRFKERVPVSDVLTGQVFERGVKLRPKWLIRAAEALISKLAPSTSFELNRKVNARALSILAATSQAVRVDRRGAEVDIRDFNVKENTTLMGGVFGESNLSAKRRKQILSKSKVAEAFTFDTENVYTFDFYQSLLDAHKYELNLGVSRANLCNFLEGQPIQLLAVGRDGREFWRYQLWHEGLLKSMGWTS